MIERTVATGTHGRYLVDVPAGAGPWPLVLGFHGYAEHAGIALERLRAIDLEGGWLRVAVQGLHRFYRGRTGEVIAGWMTREDRELAIADNLAYVAAVTGAIAREWRMSGALVYSGFSQGVAMAWRAAAAASRPAAAVVALGGDVPPELDALALSRIPAALLGRGADDEWYTQQKLEADERRLREAGVAVELCAMDGGHEWTPAFSRRAAAFLREQRR